MDIEKLIEQLKRNTDCWTDKVHGYADLRLAAATALSTLQAENEKLRAELDEKEKYYDQMIDALAATDSAELEQVKREKIRIPEGYALVKLELLEELDNFRDLGPIDRLRELAQADKEGRCVVMPCQPGDKVSYKSSTGFWCNAVIKDYMPKNIFITAETEIPNAEPLSHTFSISEVEIALQRDKE